MERALAAAGRTWRQRINLTVETDDAGVVSFLFLLHTILTFLVRLLLPITIIITMTITIYYILLLLLLLLRFITATTVPGL